MGTKRIFDDDRVRADQDINGIEGLKCQEIQKKSPYSSTSSRVGCSMLASFRLIKSLIAWRFVVAARIRISASSEMKTRGGSVKYQNTQLDETQSFRLRSSCRLERIKSWSRTLISDLQTMKEMLGMCWMDSIAYWV
ncbi:hypothetical protein NL30_21925 [Burkholderia contaminans]|nr:hypothetical protein NL30_21925 [Burkholderia contaminans]